MLQGVSSAACLFCCITALHLTHFQHVRLKVWNSRDHMWKENLCVHCELNEPQATHMLFDFRLLRLERTINQIICMPFTNFPITPCIVHLFLFNPANVESSKPFF